MQRYAWRGLRLSNQWTQQSHHSGGWKYLEPCGWTDGRVKQIQTRGCQPQKHTYIYIFIYINMNKYLVIYIYVCVCYIFLYSVYIYIVIYLKMKQIKTRETGIHIT